MHQVKGAVGLGYRDDVKCRSVGRTIDGVNCADVAETGFDIDERCPGAAKKHRGPESFVRGDRADVQLP